MRACVSPPLHSTRAQEAWCSSKGPRGRENDLSGLRRPSPSRVGTGVNAVCIVMGSPLLCSPKTNPSPEAAGRLPSVCLLSHGREALAESFVVGMDLFTAREHQQIDRAIASDALIGPSSPVLRNSPCSVLACIRIQRYWSRGFSSAGLGSKLALQKLTDYGGEAWASVGEREEDKEVGKQTCCGSGQSICSLHGACLGISSQDRVAHRRRPREAERRRCRWPARNDASFLRISSLLANPPPPPSWDRPQEPLSAVRRVETSPLILRHRVVDLSRRRGAVREASLARR